MASAVPKVLHPLSRASRLLTIRLRDLEARPEAARDQAWWEEYVRTTDVLVRCMQTIEGPMVTVSKRELQARFGLRG